MDLFFMEDLGCNKRVLKCEPAKIHEYPPYYDPRQLFCTY